MKKTLTHRLLRLGIVMLGILVLFSACDLFGPQSNAGSVVLRIAESQLFARTILPEGSEITHYFVRGTSGALPPREWGPEAVGGGVLELTDLEIGWWRFQVFALNTDGVDILSGQVDVLVRANVTSEASVTLNPVSGVGTLIVEFVWPPELLDNPTFQATLSRYQDGAFGDPETLPDEQFELNNSGPPSRYTYENTEQPSGYYLLETSIRDDSEHSGQDIDFALRVLSGLTTTAVINLETGVGSVSLTVIENRQDPLTVALTADPDTLEIDADGQIVITADVGGGTGDYAYRWSLDGVVLSDTADSITLTGLDPGRRRVSLVASDGIVLGSAWIGFDVVQ